MINVNSYMENTNEEEKTIKIELKILVQVQVLKF